MRPSIAALAALCLVATACGSQDAPTSSTTSAAASRFDHVTLIVLENTPAGDAEADPTFAGLARSGATLKSYYAIAHDSLPNYLALVAGAVPTPTTRADCPRFNCQLSTPTIADQLSAAGLDWRAYLGGTTNPCLTPAPGESDEFDHGYVLHHNPFAYSPQVGAGPGGGSAACHDHLVPLGQLGADARDGHLPAFSLLVPDSCEDGHDIPCADGRPGGLKTAMPWVARTWDALRASPGWTSRSLLIVTFDEADSDDTSGCCGTPGGGRVGMVMLSGLIAPGTSSDRPYSHYSTLRSIEDGLGLSGHLGMAGDPSTAPITDVFR